MRIESAPSELGRVQSEVDVTTGAELVAWRRGVSWASWLVGAALLVAVVLAAIHHAEEKAFLRLLTSIRPSWLLLAAVLQAGTYLAQAAVWRTVTRGEATQLGAWTAFKLSLAELFIDQALPSAGLSGTVVVARALESRGIPRRTVMASVVVNSASYYLAYILCLAVALGLLLQSGATHSIVLILSAIFVAFALVSVLVLLWIPGRTPENVWPGFVLRVPLVARSLRRLHEADPRIVHDPQLVLRAVFLHISIVLMDSATIWVAAVAMGTVALPAGVFVSFVVSTLLRTFSVVPGGMGVFEAVSVGTLELAGVPVETALSATLIFRGLSFWLPMIPGLLFSYRHGDLASKKGNLG